MADAYMKACTQCKATDTPCWRKGPEGPKSLCNKCGVGWFRFTKNLREKQITVKHDPTGSFDGDYDLDTDDEYLALDDDEEYIDKKPTKRMKISATGYQEEQLSKTRDPFVLSQLVEKLGNGEVTSVNKILEKVPFVYYEAFLDEEESSLLVGQIFLRALNPQGR